MLVQNSCYLNNPKISINKNSSQFIYNKSGDEISFCGAKSKLKFLAKTYVGVNILALVHLSLLTFGNPNQNQVEKRSGWDSNIKVLAATGQNTLAVSTGSDTYSLKLVEALLKPDTKTIEAANHSLIKSGYSVNQPFGWRTLLTGPIDLYMNSKVFNPLETYGVNLGIFNKQEKNKERFILTLYDKREERFLNSTDKFSTKMKKIYGLPSGNIINIPVDSLKNIEQGLDSFLSQINQLKNKGNVELLIIYKAHGAAESLNKGAEKVEGAMEGIMQTNQEIKETQVKELFHKKLQGIKTFFLLDTCHAGAWISENAKKSLKYWA